jgi:hypothetical protein
MVIFLTGTVTHAGDVSLPGEARRNEKHTDNFLSSR